MNDELKITENRNLGGRPAIYTHALRDAICARLAEGETLRSICRDPAMPSRPTIAKWGYENTGEEKDDQGKIIEHGFFYHYTRARDIGLDVMADDLIDISDESENDFIEKHDKNGNVIGQELNKEAVLRSRLRVDARKWYLSKMAPKRYGESRMLQHQQLDAQGEAVDPVAPQVNIGLKEIAQSVSEEFEKLEKARNDAEDTA